MNPEIITTCINCVALTSLWATLTVIAIGALMAVRYQGRQAR